MRRPIELQTLLVASALSFLQTIVGPNIELLYFSATIKKNNYSDFFLCNHGDYTKYKKHDKINDYYYDNTELNDITPIVSCL